MMSSQFGLFINLAHDHKNTHECSLLWNMISNKLLKYGFLFQKRFFTILSEKDAEEISKEVLNLFDEIQIEQSDFYSYHKDCYILHFDNCRDLTLPDTSKSIVVEDISLEELNSVGINYDSIFKDVK